MHNEVDLAPFLLQHLEHGVEGCRVGPVAMPEQETVDFPGQRLDAFLQRVTLPSQRDLRTRRMAGLCDAPGDRAVIGDAENHPALAQHQTRILRHLSFQSTLLRSGGTPAPPPGTAQMRVRLTTFAPQPWQPE